MKQNEQQRNLKDLKKEKNNSNKFGKFYWLSSSALLNPYILTNFSAFSASKLFAVAFPVQKFWGARMFNFRRITLFSLEKRLSKHKMTIFSKRCRPRPLWPPWLRLWLFLMLDHTKPYVENIHYRCWTSRACT